MSDEFGGGSNPADVDFTKLSVEERLASKLWKARVSAYEELSKAFAKTSSESDPIFRQYTRNPELLKSMVIDSNAVAQEKGVDAVRACVEYGGQAAGKSREVVAPALVDKCLGSARAGTKKNALDLISFYAEMEDVMGCDGLLADLLEGLKAKQPKIVAGCVTAITSLLHDFGHKQIAPRPILKRLPDIFAHSDKNVRAEGSLLAQELHRCIGAALQPTIDSLKDIQAKELRQQFAEIDALGEGKPVPTRFLLSQREKIETAAAVVATSEAAHAEAADDIADDGDEDIDPYDLAEPVKVFGHRDYPADLDEAMASKKWQERKDALEAILKILTSSARIHPDSKFDNLVDHLSLKIQKDANINVVLVSCQCLEAMAKGLRGEFARYKDKVVPPIIEKLKEKKQSVVEVLGRALDAIFQTVTFSDILEHILTGVKHKNPAVKTESILFLVRCLRSTKTPPAKADIKPIGDALVTAIADGSPDVRDAGAAGLGTLMKLIGERPMNMFLEGLDDIKKAKIQEEYKVATVRVKMPSASGGAAPKATAPAPLNRSAPPAAAKPRPVVAAVASGKENQAPRPVARAPAPVARAPVRPAVASSSAVPAAAAAVRRPAAGKLAAGPSGKGALSATEPVKFKYHPEDAEARANDLIPAGIASQIASGAWKERLAGMAEFNDWLKIESETVDAEIIVRALGKKPGWKESNFQVMVEVYKALQMLANDCPSFGRTAVALSIQPLCDKLGDIKLKGPAGDTLTTYAEKTSFGFVLAQALGPLASLKAPKAIADSILWVDQALLEFGTTGIDVRSLIDYLITSLKSANGAVRINATKAVGTLARFLGTALNSFIAELNSQMKATIEAEIEKAASNPPPAPVRFSEETKTPAPTAGSTAVGGSGAAAAPEAEDEDMLDELIPRVDIDRLVSPATVARMGDSNWKERKEALEEILAIVSANSRLKGSMNELANALKLRCSDSNIMCKSMSLEATAKIASAMGKHFEPHAKLLAGPIAGVLGDAKAPVRASAITALTAIAEKVGAAPMLPGFTTALEAKTANPMLKQELFAWLGTWFESHPPEKGTELAPLTASCLQCLDDKLAAVRKAAQSCLPFIIQRAGYKFVMEQASQMKQASRTTVIPLIDAARTQAQALAKSAAPAPAPAAAAGPARATAVPRNMVTSGGRTGSPAPAAPASPKVASMVRAGGVKPPSAVGRSLKAPTTIARSRLASDEAETARTVRKPVATSSTSQPATIDRSAPLISSDSKAKSARERREGKGQNWIAADGAPRPELTEILRQQCEGQLSRDLVDSMFSKGHSAEKDFYAALTLILDFISSPTFAEERYGLSPEETIERTLASSDLIFKYVAIRLTDNNTSLSIKCLEILEHLSGLLSEQQYHMSDYEAACILPCLTAKFGDAKVAFRDRIREIFRKMTFTFPPSKLVSCYMENGLPSKNARVRTECLTEIGYLFSKNGLQVCSPSRTLPVIAKQISDRDANVRTAALMTLGEAYKIIGDEIWKLVGSLPGKEMSLLEERLKRTSVPLAKPASTISPPRSASAIGATSSPAKSATMAAPSSRIVRPAATGIVAPSAGVKSRLPGLSGLPNRRESALGMPRPVRKSVGPEMGSEEAAAPSPRSSMLPPQSYAMNGESRSRVPSVSVQQELLGNELPEEEDDELSVDQAINQIVSKDVEQSIMALKHVSIFISEVEPQLIQHVDQLAIVLSKQIHSAFSPGSSISGHERLKKHLIVVGTSLFDRDRTWEDSRTLGSYLSRSALIPLLTVLLQQLLQATSNVDDRSAQMESKYINTIVLRCFSACNLNLLYGACLSMLTEATEDLRELSGTMLDTRTKFSELVVKCLWKIAKRLQNSLEERQVEAPQLYADVESFLQTIPPPEWKRRAQDGVPLGDLPLRTMKVILNNMTTHFGDDALSMLDMIPEPENSIVYSYVIRMLNASGAAEPNDEAASNQGRDSRQQPRNGVSARGSNNGESVQQAPVEENNGSQHAELRDIFQMISNKSQSRQGIRELYEFQKRNPQLEKHVENSLQKTGPIFQRFIKRALANHASEDLDVGVSSDARASTPLSATAVGSSNPVTPRRFSAAHVPDPASGSPTSSTNSPRSSSIRNPAADDRLAQLRAKFS